MAEIAQAVLFIAGASLGILIGSILVAVAGWLFVGEYRWRRMPPHHRVENFAAFVVFFLLGAVLIAAGVGLLYRGFGGGL